MKTLFHMLVIAHQSSQILEDIDFVCERND